MHVDADLNEAATFVLWLNVFAWMVMRLCYGLHGEENSKDIVKRGSESIFDPMTVWQYFGILATSPCFDWLDVQCWSPVEFSLDGKLFREF